MNRRFRLKAVVAYSLIGTILVLAIAQYLESSREERRRENRRRNRTGRSFANGPRPNRTNGGPVAQTDLPLLQRFDKDNDKTLNSDERKAARNFLETEKNEGRWTRRAGSASDESTPGLKLSPNDVPLYGKEPLYDARVLRTFFLEFENPDWEKELDDFYHTDVEVPAKLTVDGKEYSGVGVHFHGASSFFTVAEGGKRSLVISMDLTNEKQKLLGFRKLDLLNAHTDPSFLHTILYSQAAREFIPAARANYARVVVNGESWGIYINTEHFNKDFVRAYFPQSKGARWKAPGRPSGQAGLNYLGDDPQLYKGIYEIKSKDDPTAWRELIRLCRILHKTPLENLEQELEEILDVDGAVRFLALENVLINSDGYWIRSSDYNLFQDETGKFHIVPHDTNETWAPAERPRFGRSPTDEPESGARLDPLAGADNPSKPLLNRLLAIPKLRERYLGYVKQITEEWLDWKRIGPLAEQYHNMIATDVKADTRKLYSFEAFEKSLTRDFDDDTPRGPRRRMSLKTFVDERREFLLGLDEVKKANRTEAN